jgi:hypothetical protein
VTNTSVVHKSVVTENSRGSEPLGTRGGFKVADAIGLWYSSGILRRAEEVGRIQRGYLELANILDRLAKMLGSGSEEEAKTLSTIGGLSFSGSVVSKGEFRGNNQN